MSVEYRCYFWIQSTFLLSITVRIKLNFTLQSNLNFESGPRIQILDSGFWSVHCQDVACTRGENIHNKSHHQMCDKKKISHCCHNQIFYVVHMLYYFLLHAQNFHSSFFDHGKKFKANFLFYNKLYNILTKRQKHTHIFS